MSQTNPPVPPPPMASQPVPPLGSTAVLQYATPVSPAGMGHIARQGNILITSLDVDLPDICVKCAAPGDGKRFKKTYYWHSQWVFLIVLVNIIIYALVAVCVRKKAKVRGTLCRVHRRERALYLFLATITLLLGIPGFFICLIWSAADPKAPQPWLWIGAVISLGLIIVGGIWASTKARLLSPKEINRDYAWFKGAGEPFLSTIAGAR
jgi:hypothetical protein